jgi:hypothetical protein
MSRPAKISSETLGKYIGLLAGTDVMILKICSPKNWRFLLKNEKKIDNYNRFQEKRKIFAENNIDPWPIETTETLFRETFFRRDSFQILFVN